MSQIRSRSPSRQRRQSQRRRSAALALRWAVERLESRVTPATIAVTGTTATSPDLSTSEFSGNVTVAVTVPLSGTVFEDVNYGGGAGRPLAASGGVGRDGVTVELYDAAGNFLEATTTAGAAHTHSRPGGQRQLLRPRGQRHGHLLAHRQHAVAALRPDVPHRRFHRHAGRRHGRGRRRHAVGAGRPGEDDGRQPGRRRRRAVGDRGRGRHWRRSSGLDFGFNFDTVVNTNNAGQGSLRQFITNSNALGNSGLAQVGQRPGSRPASS